MPTLLVAHTHAQVWYTLAIRMAATHLFIDKQEALLGDTICVRMIPGLLSDAGSVVVARVSGPRCRLHPSR